MHDLYYISDIANDVVRGSNLNGKMNACIL